MWTKYKQQTGFTIVELLIVIVVIGILAAITIVAYNGIQKRAANTSGIAYVNQTVKAFQAYIATTNSYPGTSGRACLSGSTGCTFGGATVATDAGMNSNLSTISTLQSSWPIPATTWSKGLIYEYNTGFTYNGAQRPARLLYSLTASGMSCGVSNTANSGGTTMSGTVSATVDDGNIVLCVVSLDGPST